MLKSNQLSLVHKLYKATCVPKCVCMKTGIWIDFFRQGGFFVGALCYSTHRNCVIFTWHRCHVRQSYKRTKKFHIFYYCVYICFLCTVGVCVTCIFNAFVQKKGDKRKCEKIFQLVDKFFHNIPWISVYGSRILCGNCELSRFL